MAVALAHSNDIGEKVEGGSVTLKATFEGPPGVVSVLDYVYLFCTHCSDSSFIDTHMIETTGVP